MYGQKGTITGMFFGGLLPVLLYELVNQSVVSLGVILFRGVLEGENIAAMEPLYVQTAIQMFGMFLAALSVLSFYRKENFYAPKSKGKSISAGSVAGILGTGAGIALLLNYLFVVTGFIQNSEQYQKVAERQFSLPFWLAFLFYGILSPFAEEVLFRGILYRFFKRTMNQKIALFGSALVFGAFHGNPVQMVYGTLMGIMMAWWYEKEGRLLAPILFHGAANTAVYLISYL